jgi:hypothetical protein
MQSWCRLALVSKGNQRNDDSSAAFSNRSARVVGRPDSIDGVTMTIEARAAGATGQCPDCGFGLEA